MNKSLESVVRFVNLASSGLVAGSLGFGNSPLIPGWKDEIPADRKAFPEPVRNVRYVDAIGPIAVATSVILAVAPRQRPFIGRLLDAVSAFGLSGVLATTTLGTVRLTKKMAMETPVDYPSESSQSLTRSLSRVHAARMALGIGAFLCAAASSAIVKRPS